MKDKNLTVEQIRDRLENHSHEVYGRLNNLYHCSFMPDRRVDMFVYRLAECLECSVDYILGLSNDPDMFIPVNVSNLGSKEAEYTRLVTKYGKDNDLNIHNTNTLAYFTNVDRDVFEYLLNREQNSESWITSSYYILSRLAYSFGFDYESALNFVFDLNTNSNNKQYVTHLLNKYNVEFNT